MSEHDYSKLKGKQVWFVHPRYGYETLGIVKYLSRMTDQSRRRELHGDGRRVKRPTTRCLVILRANGEVCYTPYGNIKGVHYYGVRRSVAEFFAMQDGERQ